MKKKFLALLLGICMLLSLAPTNLTVAMADDTKPGDITLTKTKEAGKNDGEYEVTLSVAGRAEAQTENKYQDVVLLLDTTSSMDLIGSNKLTNLKKALKDDGMLLDTLLKDSNSLARVTIVCFSCWDSKTGGYGAKLIGTYTHDTLAAAKSFVEGMTVTGDSTNLQLGLMKLSEVLSELNAKGDSNGSPIVIEMTDGDPNQYQLVDWGSNYSNTSLGTVNYKLASHPSSHTVKNASNFIGASHSISEFKYIKPGTLKFFTTPYYTDGSGSKVASYTSTGGTYSMVKNDSGKSIYRKVTWVCDDCNVSYASQNGFSADQAMMYCYEDVKSKSSEVYTVAFGSTVGTATKNLLQRMATDSAHAYDVRDAGELSARFKEIAVKILCAARNASVTDPMGTQVGLVYSGSLPAYTNDLSVYEAGNANVFITAGSLTYNASTDTIEWTIGDIPFGATYVMKYRVKIDDGVYGSNIPLNNGTDITYTNTQGEEKTEVFPVPEGEQTEPTAAIEYKTVGSGSVSSSGETLKAVTGTAAGSTATAKDGFKFVGWYSDAACTKLLSTEAKYTPAKENGQYKDGAYYARFVELCGDLTVTKTGCSKEDTNQSFIFHITSSKLDNSSHAPIDMYVTVQGNGSAAVKGLPTGTYKVEESEGWSWRYESDGAKTVTLGEKGASAVFKNTRTDSSWLSSSAYAVNTADGRKGK